MAYIANSESGLCVLDISNPSTPYVVSNLNVDGGYTSKDVETLNNELYMSVEGPGLVIVNVTDPNNPWLVNTCYTGGQSLGVTVHVNHAYISDGTSGFKIINLSDIREIFPHMNIQVDNEDWEEFHYTINPEWPLNYMELRFGFIKPAGLVNVADAAWIDDVKLYDDLSWNTAYQPSIVCDEVSITKDGYFLLNGEFYFPKFIWDGYAADDIVAGLDKRYEKISSLGIDGIWVYCDNRFAVWSYPTKRHLLRILDAAYEHGLKVIAEVPTYPCPNLNYTWPQFKEHIDEWVEFFSFHPALFGFGFWPHFFVSSDNEDQSYNRFPHLELIYSNNPNAPDLEQFRYFEICNNDYVETSVLRDRFEKDGNYYALLAAVNVYGNASQECIRVYSRMMENNATVKIFNTKMAEIGSVVTRDAYEFTGCYLPYLCGGVEGNRYEGWVMFEDLIYGVNSMVKLYRIPLI